MLGVGRGEAVNKPCGGLIWTETSCSEKARGFLTKAWARAAAGTTRRDEDIVGGLHLLDVEKEEG